MDKLVETLTVAGQPVISVDAKKEMVGNDKNGGSARSSSAGHASP
jgi:hypothetical protein